MKYRANLFKKTIVKQIETESIMLVEKMNHSIVEITDSELYIEFISGEKHKYKINFSEKDISTTTHLGQFKNGSIFRLIQPIGTALEMAKINQDSKGGFTIGSVDRSGWAIHFFLTEPNDMRNSQPLESGKSEHIEKLIQGAMLAFQAGLQQKFVEVAIQMLPMIKSDPMQIYNYEDGGDVAYILSANSELFTAEEQLIIEKIELR